MSKIQEALGKIQKGKAARQQAAATSAEDSVVVAQVVDRGAETGNYAVSDRCLHIDRGALRKAGLIAPEYHEQLLANQYRDIKRPLIAHAFGKRATKVERGNLICVTSALSGEGKTFTSINLALSMARERDHSVLLVDADVAKPHTSEIFGAQGEPGLLDLLEDSAEPVRSLILPTDIENLSILPAGKPRHHATELLASDAMENVAQTLANLNTGQIVVFDSPPILQTSEAKVVTSLAGQIVVVVRAERTSHDAVCAAVAALDQDQAISLVLNQVRSKSAKYQWGYGYGQASHTGNTDDSGASSSSSGKVVGVFE